MIKGRHEYGRPFPGGMTNHLLAGVVAKRGPDQWPPTSNKSVFLVVGYCVLVGPEQSHDKGSKEGILTDEREL